MTYDIFDELIDTAEYFVEEYGAEVGKKINPIHGTSIKMLCKMFDVDKRQVYNIRSGMYPVLNARTCRTLDMMGYELHLIPKDKVKEVMKVCYEV